MMDRLAYGVKSPQVVMSYPVTTPNRRGIIELACPPLTPGTHMTDFPPRIFHGPLLGQVALVTGTTSGPVAALRSLAKCGAKVALTGRRTDRLERLQRRSVGSAAHVSRCAST
jgi:hypothetical protein